MEAVQAEQIHFKCSSTLDHIAPHCCSSTELKKKKLNPRHRQQIKALLVDLLRLLPHGGRRAPLQIFATLPERQVFSWNRLEKEERKKKKRVDVLTRYHA